jgi:ribonucleoside-diphosphate reductase alpha chain
LGSIFLTYFIKEENGKKEVDWDKLEKVTHQSVRLLDNVIEVNPFPLPEIRKVAFNIRRIGLGVGGWSDMLLSLGIPYDSDEAMLLAEKVMKFIQDAAVMASEKLAKDRGPFFLWPVSIYREGTPRRHSTVTTIAPTGTISIIAGASSGIEPMFAIAYQHVVKDKHLDRKLSFVNPKFEEMARDRGFWSEDLMAKVAEKGVVRDIPEIPEDVKRLFGTAHEIDIDWHIKTQAAFQKYTENAVSKTINLRHDATVDDVKKAYISAWESNCKGITIFRDGSKSEQVLNLGLNQKEAKPENDLHPTPMILERPMKVEGATYRIVTPLGSAFITVNQDALGNPFEVFITIGKAGSEVAAMAEALGRMISTTLRFGNHLPPLERAKEIVEQLHGIGGGRSVGFGPNKIRSLPDGVAKALSLHFGFGNMHGNHETPEESQSVVLKDETKVVGDICPACGSPALVYQEGCSKCHACGHSEC